MTFKDLELKYRGWQELRRADLFNSWEQTRHAALFSLHHPIFQYPKGQKFDRRFPNPYGEQPKKRGVDLTPEEVEARLKKWDTYEYKKHPLSK